MTDSTFKGTIRLTGLLFRQLRTKIMLWLIGFGVVVVATITAYPGTYPDDADRKGFAVTVDNPAMQALFGKGYGLEDFLSVTASLFAQETLMFTLIIVGVMNIMLMKNITRQDEEEGRIEYIRSLPVGRLSYISASSIVMAVVNALLSLIIGLGLWATTIEGTDWESSFLYGITLGITGLVFAAITALVAQLTETARGTTVISFGVLALIFLMRAIGDISNDTLSIISPFEWGMRTNVFIDNHWWPVLASFITSIIILAAAFQFHRMRDVGSGLIPAKPGKNHASGFLKTPFGFAASQQRSMIIIWMIFIAAFSGIFGYVLNDLETYFADNPLLEQVLGSGGEGVQDQFVTLLISLMSLISVIPPVMIILALKKEETGNRIANLLSKAISRTRLLGSYVILSILTSVVMQVIVALCLWGAGKAVMDQPLEAGDIFLGSFIYLAASWGFIGLTLLLVGMAPKIADIVWVYLVFGFIIIFFGGLLDFPDWVNNLSVFEALPSLPGDDFASFPFFVVLGIGTIMALAGFIGYTKRDIER